jgi:hypothetical protein
MAVTATLQSDAVGATKLVVVMLFSQRILSVAPIAVREFLDQKHLMQNTHNHKLKW